MTAPLLILLGMISAFTQGEAPPSYAQTYAIFIHGQRAGTESVTERPDKDGGRMIRSQHEMLITDGLEAKRMAFETDTAFARESLVPARYSYRYLSGVSKDYYEVTCKDGRFNRIMSRGGNIIESSGALRSDTLFLDFNVYHQYDLLARVYDFKKRGRQVFHDFIPAIGSEVDLAVTWLEDARLEYDRGAIPVRNYKIEFVGVRSGNLSTDMAGRLVRLIMREQDLEVVRQDLVSGK